MSRVVAARAAGCSAPIPFVDGVDTARDPCAVVTHGLALVVEKFVTEYGRAGGNGDVLNGAIQELVRRTQAADPAGRGVSDKTIRSVIKRAYTTTDLRTADALVTAARRPFALQDGTLAVIQNERAAATVRTTCCGSAPGTSAPTLAEHRASLTGAL